MAEFVLTVNGQSLRVAAEAHVTLLEVLRETLFLTGAKEACGVGECGNCLVLVDGDPIPSCLMLGVDARERSVETIEGFAVDGELDEVQQAFVEAGAFQCGFCTTGMLVAAAAFVRDHSDATSDEVAAALAGVLCRCGSYPRVQEAIRMLMGGRVE